MNSHEIMCVYAAKNLKKVKQLVLTAVFNASTYVLCQICVIEYLYQSFNKIIF
jgi:hypothetical protein